MKATLSNPQMTEALLVYPHASFGFHTIYTPGKKAGFGPPFEVAVAESWDN